MRNLSIRTAVFSVLGALALVSAVQNYVTLQKFAAVDKNVAGLASTWLPSITAVGEVTNAVANTRLREVRHIIATNEAERTDLENEIRGFAARLEAARTRYAQLISSAAERTTYDEFVRNWDTYRGLHDKVLTLSRGNDIAAATALFKGEQFTVYKSILGQIDTLVALAAKGAEAEAASADANYQ